MSGCPVVASDIPVFHEVAGPAALFFDHRLSQRLAEGAAASLEPDIRARLVAEGYVHSRRFSWARAADQVRRVYEEASALRH